MTAKNKSTYQDYLCGSKWKKIWLILMICILKTETNVWSLRERKGRLGMSLTVSQEIGMFSPIFTCTLSKLKLWIHGIQDCFDVCVMIYIHCSDASRELQMERKLKGTKTLNYCAHEILAIVDSPLYMSFHVVICYILRPI